MRLPAGPVAFTAVVLVVAACSGGDDAAPITAPPETDVAASPGADDQGTEPTVRPTAPTTAPSDDGADAATDDASSGPSTPPTDVPVTGPSTTVELVEVPETGVPGLDSADSFCAAWSRFGGTWQVIQVAANFAPDPSVVPALEITAAPVVARAYDAMFAAWPDELAEERDTVASGFFGPLDRRAGVALDALAEAGATDADLTALAAAWEAALAARRPEEPVVSPQLSDAMAALVAAAAADLDARLVGFVDDPSMLITVETPRTDAYLATACPDQGALTGGEVEG